MKKKPARPQSLRTVGKTVARLSRDVARLKRDVAGLQRKERVIRGFGPVDAIGDVVEQEDDDE